ncbi:hypothetical protein TR13x_06105 [Caloranaerobacter sp. TR13]|uniref:DUF2194 domain-containing protein n=1 Tax=Caloranaerobacter sp. TR13 TaxID=1302151 RepID=UPI0006D40165|nr:DUF2194 domain-containing protein [Caloranaerobacter sp. TR13]KPU27313.1 hypothetical protein TR13x_06105 [Caloranaerobacter sp. TR13]
MKNRKNLVIILTVVLLSATLIQVFRSEILENIFGIRQKEKAIDFKYISTEIPNSYNKILVLFSDKDKGSKDLYKNIFYTFKMAKLNCNYLKIDSDKVAEEIKKLKHDDLLVIGTERVYELKNYKSILEYINNGGKAVFLVRGYYPPFDKMIGIAQNRGFSNGIVEGYKSMVKFFPGLDEIEIKDKKVSNSILDVDLDKDVNILAVAEKRPIVWIHEYGRGKVLYVNSTLLMDKANRGLLLQYTSYINDYFLTTIFNGKIVDIDDFPAPIKPGRDEIIYNQYHMNNRQFYRNIWWSFLYNLAEKYNLKYTGLVIGTYSNDTTSPIRKLNKQELNDIKYFGRKLAELNGEIGIHGYNHNSLALKGQMEFEKYSYTPWESFKTIEEGLKVLKGELEKLFGDVKIFTYVPPSNIISRDGKIAVKKVFKDVKVFAGLYTGEKEKSVLYQEFGKDPDIPDTYDFPRISAGYHYDKKLMWDIYNGIAHYGIFNHFIHPDDLLDVERSKGMTWRKLEKNFERIIKEVYNNFPFLVPMTDYEAYINYLKLEKLKVYTKKVDNTIYIYYENGVVPIYHFLRSKEKVKKVEGGYYKLIDKDRNLYLIEGRSPVVKVILE